MQDYLEVCERAARSGGRVLLQQRDSVQVSHKGPRDLVTNVDLASQEVIRETLLGSFPDHLFLGEEHDADSPRLSAADVLDSPDYCWIVDPLDGTTNYVHRLQTFAVSVALQRAGKLLVGVVFDPVMDECFSAVAGEGARLNGRPISTSGCRELENALVATSFSACVPRGSPEVSRFIEVLHECRALRRLGSAALNLCYLAAGRLDAYWASSVKLWDVAAGLLIVAEAGGEATRLDGTALDLARPEFAAAATSRLHTRLTEVLSRAAG